MQFKRKIKRYKNKNKLSPISKMGYKRHCKRRCDCHRHKHKRKPDIVLRPTDEAERVQEEPYPLPMIVKNCKWELVGGFSSPQGNPGLVLTTLKKNRELVVKVKVATNIKVELSIQTGTETPRIISFEDVEDVKFVEELKKGDTIVFFQTYNGETPVELDFKVLIRKKHYC